MGGMFTRPENGKMYWKEFMHQCSEIGIGSLADCTDYFCFSWCGNDGTNGLSIGKQHLYLLTTIAIVVSDSMLFELSPTIICVVLAGVAGSKIASELGNMRVSEQIDALKLWASIPKHT
jgi:phospholipid/cholesterol/gamma-HCH transport system permease protein